jgi:hypothetical protein
MKQALKKAIRDMALTVLAAAAVNSAHAYASLGGTYYASNNCAVVGFCNASGLGNELDVNLGPITNLYVGEQWNLNTLLTGATGSGYAGLGTNNIDWGVIGSSGSLGVGNYYATAIYQPQNTPDNAQNVNELTHLFGSPNTSQAGQIPSTGYLVQSTGVAWSWALQVDGSANGTQDSTCPYAVLNGSPCTETPASGSYTFAQDSATWYVQGPGGGATTNYFAFNSAGILIFTNLVVSSGPPAPKIVAITRANTTTTIYFTTTNSFTYSLYYTNSAGLTAPTTNWAVSLTTLTGNGLTNSLSDTTANANRFYRIGVH